MLALGVITYVGLQLLGVPLALLLAVVSGLAAFVPIIGPMIAGALMVLVALSESWQLALWAGGFYLLLQTLESYLLTPLIQERAVDLPPAVVIAAQVLMGFPVRSPGHHPGDAARRGRLGHDQAPLRRRPARGPQVKRTPAPGTGAVATR
jgi:hypothetical protein